MRTRRQFTAEFKAQRVLEVLSGRKTAAAVCREYQLKPDLLTRWKAYFVTHAVGVFALAHSPRAPRIVATHRNLHRLTQHRYRILLRMPGDERIPHARPCEKMTTAFWGSPVPGATSPARAAADGSPLRARSGVPCRETPVKLPRYGGETRCFPSTLGL